MASLVIENLCKHFKGAKGELVTAVQNANLQVADREFVVLVGPSGCGKTTILRLIAGLEEITGGTIAIDGKIVNQVEPKDRDIAMVFQNYALYPHMTVYENMAFALKLRRVPRVELDQRVQDAAVLLGLTEYLHRLPKALSGGQRQRVALGRAIVRKPKVFLFDEPLSNLDAQMRTQMRTEIARLHTRLGATMIYVTHDQVEAMTLGQRVVVMRDGVIQQIGTPLSLYHEPANRFVAGFIGSPPMNIFRGRLQAEADGLWFVFSSGSGPSGSSDRRWRLDSPIAAKLAAYANCEVEVGIRPEHLCLGLPGAADDSGIRARVEVVELLGPETLVHLSAGTHRVIARVRPEPAVAAGETCMFSLDLSRARFFDPRSGQTCF